MKKFILLLTLALLAANTTWARELYVCQTEAAKYQYRIELANLILSKTAQQFGPGRIAPITPKDPTQQRCLRLLKHNLVDLVYLPPTEQRLAELEAIKIDIHNGMLGYRVLLINKQDKESFSRVKTLDDLRGFIGGFGSHWADYKVFSLNDLPVVGVADAKNLLGMLSKQRFDYFHRGLHEAWEELGSNGQRYPHLIVEPSIALVYDYPVYFMFNQQNAELKARFEAGFDIILKDGSFKALYQKHFADYATKANLKNRNLIRIKYPMPKGLPPPDTSLWLP